MEESAPGSGSSTLWLRLCSDAWVLSIFDFVWPDLAEPEWPNALRLNQTTALSPSHVLNLHGEAAPLAPAEVPELS
jgi:hypothetical protein